MSNDNQKDPLSYWQLRAFKAESERDELKHQCEAESVVCDSYRNERDELAANVERLRGSMTDEALDLIRCGIGSNYGNGLREKAIDRVIGPIRQVLSESPQQSLREVRHQERERAALICDEEADEWDSDRLVTHKNYAAYCARRIRSGEL